MEQVLEKRSNLVLPTTGYELDREEMSYIDGGGISVTAFSAIIDISLIAITGAINVGLRAAGFFGKGAAKKFMLKSAPAWAKVLHKGANIVGCSNMIGSLLATAGNTLYDVSSYIGKITNFFSIGGIIGSILDICDGNWDGYISF